MLGKVAIATAFAAGCLAGSQGALADASRSIVQRILIGRSAEALPLGRGVASVLIDAVEARDIARRHGLKPPFQAARTPFGWSLFRTGAARGAPTLVVLYLDGQLLAIR